jgi:uncharacterized membrane protein YgcG
MRRTVASLLVIVLAPCLIAAAPATQRADEKSDRKVPPVTALQKKIGEINFNSIALQDAVDYLRDVTRTNIHVNWRALELMNVTRQTLISVKLNDVSLRRVLKSVLDETGAGEQLTWYIDEGVIEITTREIADNQLITRVYPVDDLVMEVPNFAGPSFNLQNQQAQVSGGGGGGRGGSSTGLFTGSGGGGGGANGTYALEATTKQQRADSLVKLIQETIKPEVWRENGGTASIRYFNGHLIVTAPRSVHEAISGRP